MTSVAEPVVERITDPTLSDSLVSSGSDWSLLGDLMIDLGGGDRTSPLKMPSEVAENLAPKPDTEKGLKMKIKRKSKHEEKHEVVLPDVDKSKEEEQPNCAPSAKKAKVDKADSSKRKACAQQSSSNQKRDAGVNTATVGTSVEPDCLGPCETGTNISLDGLVWLETTTGLLVVNVTWRGRTYVGTLLDSSQHEFAPPCPKDYVPPMETLRNARGRGKRRGGGTAQLARSRRLGRQLPLSSKSDESDDGGGASRPEAADSRRHLPHIKCPEIGCDKRFSNIQALKWHTVEQHDERKVPANLHELSAVQSETLLREEKSRDGSSVFKVPQAKLAQAASVPGPKTSSPKTVTVSKTCPVPAGPLKEEKAPPAAQGPFKPIQPKLEPQADSAETAILAELREKKKKRRSPERPPALAPKVPTGAPALNGAPRKCHRKSDPVSPAYSDISDEGSAPFLEKEEPSKAATPPPQQPQQQQQQQSQPQMLSQQSQAQSQAPEPGPAVAKASTAQTSTTPTTRAPASTTPVAKSGTLVSRGSPNASQKPSVGSSPTEESKMAEERRQLLAENSDIREQRECRTPQLQSPSAAGRPNSRQSLPPALLLGPHSLGPNHFPPGFDYRFLGATPFVHGYGLPAGDKAAFEAIGYPGRPFLMQQHKIHELAAGSTSPGAGKTPPPHHPFSRPPMDAFAHPMGPPFSVASAMVPHPPPPFLPHK